MYMTVHVYVELPGPPTNIKLDSNATCVFLSAEEPDNSNGDITHYKVRCTVNSINFIVFYLRCY